MSTVERAYARSSVAVLFGALVGSLLAWSGDPATLVLGVGMVLLASLGVRGGSAAARRVGLVLSDGIGRRHRAWSRMPLPLRDPGLPGRPQPRAPGRDLAGTTA